MQLQLIEAFWAISPALVTYLLVMGAYNALLAPLGITYTKKPVLTVGYYLCASGLLVLLYWNMFNGATITPSSTWSTIGLFFLGAILALLPPVVSMRKKGLERIAKTNKNVFVLQMGYPYIVSKSFEILFQQGIVLFMTLSLASIYNGSLSETIVTYSLLFGLLHLPLILVMSPKFTLAFTIAAALSGLVFPPLILQLEGGFVFSYIVHWMFYVVFVLFLATKKPTREMFRRRARVLRD